MKILSELHKLGKEIIKNRLALVLLFVVSFPFYIFADANEPDSVMNSITIPERATRVQEPKAGVNTLFTSPDSVPADSIAVQPIIPITEVADSISLADSISNDMALVVDSIAADSIPKEFSKRRKLNLDPSRAVWLSALCPGLGQIYNRRYWKLPIVVGGFVGLTYATTWNNRMLTDYTKAYRDIMDSDPNTKSYMDFYPPNTQESDIDMAWLKKSLKSKKNFYRRNRDLCIIGMVGLYLINIIDAYVDATLSHFDISSDLSLDVSPAVMGGQAPVDKSFGVQCALTF